MSNQENRDHKGAKTPHKLETVESLNSSLAGIPLPEGELSVAERLWSSPKIRKLLLWASVFNGLMILSQPLALFLNHYSRFVSQISFLSLIAAIFLLMVSSPPVREMDKIKIDLRRWPSGRGFLITVSCLFIQWFANTCYWSQHNSIGEALSSALLVSLIFPVTGALSYWLGEKLLKSRALAKTIASVGNNTAEKPRLSGNSTSLAMKLKSGTAEILTQTYPYHSLYSGFVCFAILLAFLPHGIGEAVASWLIYSMRDANLSGWENSDKIISFISSSAVLLLLTGPFSGVFARLSAGYQTLLKALISSSAGDSFFSAFKRTLNTRSKKIPLPEKHPHLRSAFETLNYISFCYLLIFGMVAFLPSPTAAEPVSGSLFYGIANWLQASMRDANLGFLHYEAAERIFVAAYCAACASVPFAVMSSTFLPARKEQLLYLSEQGILLPHVFGRKLHFWSELKSVQLMNAGKKNESIKLCFKKKTLKLPCAAMEKDKLAELLASADEYSDSGCRIDSSIIALRTKLSKENSSSSLSQTSKFESTIFTPQVPGTSIREFRIIRKLSSKPLSAVYLARTSSGELCVLKQFVMPSESTKNKKIKESFQKECTLLQSLNYPGIARIIDSFEEEGSSYIAMEHIKGVDLRELVKTRGARKESIVVDWAVQICKQLSYLHNHKEVIVHRDLSPDNLMLDESGQVRIIDFGAAHQFMEGVTGTLIGKQAYIAPEQLRGKASTRSDIYSLGATLYFLLSGEDPKALQEADLLEKGFRVSKDMSNLVKRCTSFDESERPVSCQDLLSKLNELKGSTDQMIEEGKTTAVSLQPAEKAGQSTGSGQHAEEAARTTDSGQPAEKAGQTTVSEQHAEKAARTTGSEQPAEKAGRSTGTGQHAEQTGQTTGSEQPTEGERPEESSQPAQKTGSRTKLESGETCLDESAERISLKQDLEV